MSVTPIHVAKLANTRRHLAEILSNTGCPYPEETARAVLDEMRTLGWEAPGWTDDSTIPQPATSSPAARRAAIEAAKAAVDEAKRKRTTKVEEAK